MWCRHPFGAPVHPTLRLPAAWTVPQSWCCRVAGAGPGRRGTPPPPAQGGREHLSVANQQGSMPKHERMCTRPARQPGSRRSASPPIMQAVPTAGPRGERFPMWQRHSPRPAWARQRRAPTSRSGRCRTTRCQILQSLRGRKGVGTDEKTDSSIGCRPLKSLQKGMGRRLGARASAEAGRLAHWCMPISLSTPPQDRPTKPRQAHRSRRRCRSR